MTKAKKHSKDYEHEINIKILDIMAKDPSFKYFLGAAAGMGATWASVWLEQRGYYNSATNQPPETQEAKDWWATAVDWGETLVGIGSPLASAAGLLDFNKNGEGGLAGTMNNLLTFGAASFTAFCMANCLAISLSGGGSSGGGLIGKAAGAIV